MTGTLDETYLKALEDEEDAGQSSIFSYTEEGSNHTRIAVVSKPNNTGILELTDEFMPSLGMPMHLLTDFQSIKFARSENPSVEDHNKAFTKCDLEEGYRSHLEYNTEAQERLEEIENRLREGEDITLVCFEKPPKKCHRHILKDVIEKRMLQSVKS